LSWIAPSIRCEFEYQRKTSTLQMIGGAINDDVDGNEFVQHVTRAAAVA
jgi:hypothetical protein